MHPYALRMDTERKRQIFARIQATPEGFVRTYGDVVPGAPRVAGAALSDGDDPELSLAPDRPRRRLAGKGRRQRRLLEAEGVPFRGDRVDMRKARLPDL